MFQLQVECQVTNSASFEADNQTQNYLFCTRMPAGNPDLVRRNKRRILPSHRHCVTPCLDGTACQNVMPVPTSLPSLQDLGNPAPLGSLRAPALPAMTSLCRPSVIVSRLFRVGRNCTRTLNRLFMERRARPGDPPRHRWLHRGPSQATTALANSANSSSWSFAMPCTMCQLMAS